MTKPVIILDPCWRRVDELFSQAALAQLTDMCELVWGQNQKMPHCEFVEALRDAEFVIQAQPEFDHDGLDRAPKLRAIMEVSGAFPDTIDYAICKNRGIDVLCCAPGFRNSVAEMAVAMALSGARGLVTEHENFRTHSEHWLTDNEKTDFTLYGATVGFVGFGSIARETARLLAPFSPDILAHDVWLDPDSIKNTAIRLTDLESVMSEAQCIFITAAPTSENKGMIGRNMIAKMQSGALLVLISRAHLVDFDALTVAAVSGHIRVASDVFPEEPLPDDHPIRSARNVILSPHRAAAVKNGRHLIGDMIVEDIARMIAGEEPINLQSAKHFQIEKMRGVGDAASAAALRSDA